MKRLHLLWALALAGCGQSLGGGARVGDAGAGAGDATPDVTDEAPPCADELSWFTRELYRPVLATRCIGCHTADGIAHATRMVLVPEGDPDWEAKDFAAVRRVVRAELAGEPLLLLKPSLRHPDGHTGGRLVPEGSPEYATLQAFVARVRSPACEPDTTGPAACADARPGRPILRRLTPDEYDRSIHDLFGLDAAYGPSFAADPVVEGFRNRAEALTVSPLLADQLRVAAEDVAARVARAPAALGACAAQAGAGEPCIREILAGFGTRVFRRPLTPAEIDTYAGLYRTGADGGTFADGLELVLTAMLQSPSFLYRSEIGTPDGDGRSRLSPYETATALSYLITGSTPDDALLAAAAAGHLDTADGREAEARRLLATPAHRARLEQFVRAWLDLDRLAVVPKDPATYPDLTDAVRAAMRRELDAFVDQAVFAGTGKLPELLTADYTVLDDALAAFYHLDGRGLVRPPQGERAGLLTLGATMTVYARANETGPIQRGRLVRERLLCQPIPPPPPGVVATPPPAVPGQSTRERYATHSTVQPCAGCHHLMDPVGFAFEHFDGVGRWRDVDDAAGDIQGSVATDGEVDGTAALGAKLADSAEVQDCFARQAFRFAYGVADDADTACLLRGLQDAFRAGDLDVEGLFVALARSEQLAWRAGDAPAPEAPAPDAGAADAGAPEPDAGAPPPAPSTVDVEDTVESEWPQGACHQVHVHNPGADAVTWTVTLDVDGKIDQHWNCEPDADTGPVTFRGSSWNAELAAGADTSFGYCSLR
jgi:hypothetical protein